MAGCYVWSRRRWWLQSRFTCSVRAGLRRTAAAAAALRCTAVCSLQLQPQLAAVADSLQNRVELRNRRTMSGLAPVFPSSVVSPSSSTPYTDATMVCSNTL